MPFVYQNSYIPFIYLIDTYQLFTRLRKPPFSFLLWVNILCYFVKFCNKILSSFLLFAEFNKDSNNVGSIGKGQIVKIIIHEELLFFKVMN